MKQKKDKAETAKAIFSKENLGFINELDSKEMAKLRLLQCQMRLIVSISM